MKNSAFIKFLNMISELNHDQRVTVKNVIDNSDSMNYVCDIIENAFEENAKCPHCDSSMMKKNGFRSGLVRYRCKCCKRSFNALTGTPFAHLRKKELWLKYLQCMIESKTIRQSADDCDVHRNTSFRWRHRFLLEAHDTQPQLLSGIVESDETFFRKSEKGSKKLNRPPHKRGKDNAKKGLSKEQVCVVVMCDRSGNEADYISGTGPVSAKWIYSNLMQHISHDSILVTDGSSSFNSFCSNSEVEHKVVVNKEGKRIQGPYHIQNINAYHSSLKNWMRRFNGVATKYLNNYLAWNHKLKEHIDSSQQFLQKLIVAKTPLIMT